MWSSRSASQLRQALVQIEGGCCLGIYLMSPDESDLVHQLVQYVGDGDGWPRCLASAVRWQPRLTRRLVFAAVPKEISPSS